MESRRVANSLPNAFYFREFISEDQEDLLIRQVNSAPIPKWRILSNRRLQTWGGTPSAKGMMIEPLPPYIEPYFDNLVTSGAFDNSHRPNHVLINEYLPGQGIMPHEDGPYYHPVVSTISLGCQTLLDFYRPISRDDSGIAIEENASYENRYLFSLLLERRSLIILTDQMYKSCLHGIAERHEDLIDPTKIANFDLISDKLQQQILENPGKPLPREDTRISLTIRNVPRAIKIDYQKLLYKS